MSDETNKDAPPAGNPAPGAPGKTPTLKMRPVLRTLPGSPAASAGAPDAASAAPSAPPSAPPAAPKAIRLSPAGKPGLTIRKPVIGAPAKPPAAPPAVSPAGGMKAKTAPVGALHKTGIIAEGVLTPAQQQAAKSKTSRISLESAMGVAPTKAPTPLKTIRMRRPGGISSAQTSASPAPGLSPVPPPAAPPAPPGGESPTQRKTLKIHRPGEGSLRTPPAPPAADLATAPTVENAPGGPAKKTIVFKKPTVREQPAADDGAAAENAPAPAAKPVYDDGKLPGMPRWLMVITSLAALAALAAAGFTGYLFYRQGTGPNADGNCLTFMKDPKPCEVDWCHPPESRIRR